MVIVGLLFLFFSVVDIFLTVVFASAFWIFIVVWIQGIVMIWIPLNNAISRKISLRIKFILIILCWLVMLLTANTLFSELTSSQKTQIPIDAGFGYINTMTYTSSPILSVSQFNIIVLICQISMLLFIGFLRIE